MSCKTKCTPGCTEQPAEPSSSAGLTHSAPNAASGCCQQNAELEDSVLPTQKLTSNAMQNIVQVASRLATPTEYEVEISVPGMHCAGCIHKIESALLGINGVTKARVNLTAKRVRVRWLAQYEAPPVLDVLEQTGFQAQLAEQATDNSNDTELKRHIKALAVAGFAAGNVMLLSLSVWSGAGEQTRHLFHFLSAGVAIPALIFSSRVFFSSAWQAVKVGKSNMDVPICVGIILTTLLSLYDTLTGGKEVYFDAAIMLVFFLLIGRTLDVRMRAKAKDISGSLKRLQPSVATVLSTTGQAQPTNVTELVRGDRLLIETNERIPVDCRIVSGESTVDMSLVNGESVPVWVSPETLIYSGCMNLDGALTVEVVNAVADSFMARIEQAIEDADTEKGRYHQLADNVVKYYTPFVHAAALCGFLAWMWITSDWYQSITIGVVVLIITCPCALGLAVPITRVIAGQQLFLRGILMRNGAALEQLALTDTAIFDKTGTLTSGMTQFRPEYSNYSDSTLRLARSLCRGSTHPFAKALLQHDLSGNPHGTTPASADWQQREHVAGAGIEAILDGDHYRFGREEWARQLASQTTPAHSHDNRYACSILSKNGECMARFAFDDTLRPEAVECIASLKRQNMDVELLSGDTEERVGYLADQLGIHTFSAAIRPTQKADRIRSRQSSQSTVLMIGDGINDSPALSAADISMAPGTAADMTRKIADFVLLNDNLMAIPEAIKIARKARKITKQNLALAVGYNVIALPLAMTGFVTPLFAAVAMSLSSALVVANSLRLASFRTPAARKLIPSTTGQSLSIPSISQ